MNAPSTLAQHRAVLLPESVFSLTTTWRVDAPIQQVWEAIREVSKWPHWWPYVDSVTTVTEGDATGLGAVHRFTWKSALPYRLNFSTRITQIQAPFAIDGEASGDLSGWGRWRLFRTGGLTLVRYQWDVMPTKPWMRKVAPYTRPIFEWNHARVMRAGELGLGRWLGDPIPGR